MRFRQQDGLRPFATLRAAVDAASRWLVIALAFATVVAASTIWSRPAHPQALLTWLPGSAAVPKNTRPHLDRKARRSPALATRRPARAEVAARAVSVSGRIADAFAAVRGQPLRDATPLPVRAIRTIAINKGARP